MQKKKTNKTCLATPTDGDCPKKMRPHFGPGKTHVQRENFPNDWIDRFQSTIDWMKQRNKRKCHDGNAMIRS